jgi:trimeric autotransporter adhesin
MSTINVDIVDPQSGVIVEVNGVNIFSYPSLHPTPPANSNNTALGDGALEADLVQQTTFGNTAVGYRSGYSTYAGQHNTSVGCSTLVNNQDGLFNTAVGSFAGENLTSGDNNVCLGYLSTPATATSNNSITLGNSMNTVIRAAVTTITSLSDARDKKNIEESKYGLDLVESLKPVTFEWETRDGAKKDIKK